MSISLQEDMLPSRVSPAGNTNLNFSLKLSLLVITVHPFILCVLYYVFHFNFPIDLFEEELRFFRAFLHYVVSKFIFAAHHFGIFITACWHPSHARVLPCFQNIFYNKPFPSFASLHFSSTHFVLLLEFPFNFGIYLLVLFVYMLQY